MEEPKINSLQQMYVGFTALNSFLGMLTQHHPEMTLLKVEFENKNSFQEHQSYAKVTVHPGYHSIIERFLCVLMKTEEQTTFVHHVEADEYTETAYDLVTKETHYLSADGVLWLIIVSHEREYHDMMMSDLDAQSIMGIMSDIKQKADQILEGS